MIKKLIAFACAVFMMVPAFAAREERILEDSTKPANLQQFLRNLQGVDMGGVKGYDPETDTVVTASILFWVCRNTAPQWQKSCDNKFERFKALKARNGWSDTMTSGELQTSAQAGTWFPHVEEVVGAMPVTTASATVPATSAPTQVAEAVTSPVKTGSVPPVVTAHAPAPAPTATPATAPVVTAPTPAQTAPAPVIKTPAAEKASTLAPVSAPGVLMIMERLVPRLDESEKELATLKSNIDRLKAEVNRRPKDDQETNALRLELNTAQVKFEAAMKEALAMAKTSDNLAGKANTALLEATKAFKEENARTNTAQLDATKALDGLKTIKAEVLQEVERRVGKVKGDGLGYAWFLLLFVPLTLFILWVRWKGKQELKAAEAARLQAVAEAKKILDQQLEQAAAEVKKAQADASTALALHEPGAILWPSGFHQTCLQLPAATWTPFIFDLENGGKLTVPLRRGRRAGTVNIGVLPFSPTDDIVISLVDGCRLNAVQIKLHNQLKARKLDGCIDLPRVETPVVEPEITSGSPEPVELDLSKSAEVPPVVAVEPKVEAQIVEESTKPGFELKGEGTKPVLAQFAAQRRSRRQVLEVSAKLASDKQPAQTKPAAMTVGAPTKVEPTMA